MNLYDSMGERVLNELVWFYGWNSSKWTWM